MSLLHDVQLLAVPALHSRQLLSQTLQVLLEVSPHWLLGQVTKHVVRLKNLPVLQLKQLLVLSPLQVLHIELHALQVFVEVSPKNPSGQVVMQFVV